VNNRHDLGRQFVDLNEKIGGFDRDATIVPQRTVRTCLLRGPPIKRAGSPTAAGARGDAVIDFRDYNDVLPGGDIHVRYHSSRCASAWRRRTGAATTR